MSESSPSRSPTPEAVLRRLEWTVIRRLDGVLHGDYRTLFRGYGLDLADLREYQYHDDVRHIDWNVTARLQTPYVREYNEEREVAAWFLLDLCASVDFGSQQLKKQAVSAEFVTVLARILTRHGNRVGALFYGDRVDTVIPARSGRRQVLHILHRMLTRPARAQSAATDLGELLQTAYRVVPRRSLVFVVSDFISAPGWAEPLAHLAQRHDVVAVRLYDPLEMELPDLGMVVVQDAETGEQLFVDTHDRGFRRRFAAAAERREAELRAAFRNAGVDALELSTDDDLVDAILRFADLRKRRSQLAAGGGLPQHLGVARMTFLWPEMLWLLFLVPVVVLALRAAAAPQEEGRAALREPRTIRDAMGAGQRLRRHVPPLLFLVALTLMLVAIARPAAVVTLPSQHETVILAMDVSGSMRATDVKPNRIAAAQEAARAFVAEQPKSTRIGVVSFAATASVVQSPTHSREDILAAIDRFQLQRGTAVGSGILVSLKMIFPDAEFDLRSFNPRREAAKSAPLDHGAPAGQAGAQAGAAGLVRLRRDHPAHRRPDDRRAPTRSNRRAWPPIAAFASTRSASARTDGETIGAEGWSMRVRLDEETLKTIANLTHGEYFYAGNATDLQKIYKSLNSKLFFEKKETEITALFAARGRGAGARLPRCCRCSGSTGFL